jgi:hypothetical protein
MTIRTQIRAGGVDGQHNEALRVRSTVKAGGENLNHSETLRVRSTVKAGGWLGNHNETLRAGSAPAIAMLRQPRTTSRKEDRLELLVIRAGLRAGRARLRARGRSRR